MRVSIVPATEEHAEAIGQNPRPADMDEVWASHRMTVRAALDQGIKTGRSYAVLMDDEPVLIFGVVPFSILGGIGVVWALGSRAMERRQVQREFLRYSRKVLEVVQEWFPTMLYNFVDVRNAEAIRWLRWMGFTIAEPQPIGFQGELFHPFFIHVRAKENVSFASQP